MKLWIDTETRGAVPLKQGIAKYSTAVEIILIQWAVDDGPAHVEETPSPELIAAAEAADEVWAHGAEFDRSVLETTDWWPLVPWEKWCCTMALCRMHGLPGGLDKLSTIFGLGADEAKDKRGRELIQLFCVPRKDGKYNDKRSHPKEWLEFLDYGDKDVVAMRAIWRKCPKWNATPRVWAFWHLDQRMNARGVAVDLLLAEEAVKATTIAKKRMAARTAELTDNEVEATTQRDRLLAYMEGYGVWLPDLKADTVERRLEDEALPEHIKELLRVRQQASKSSSAKYQRALNQHVGGRLRNLLVFCGAARTGRWAGRTLQPQNLPRPKHPQWEIDLAIRMFRCGQIDLYDPDNTLGLASSCLRGLIVAAEGRKLVVSDLANIEGRYMAWVAGEQWKLAAFAAFDCKKGPDLYKLAYGSMFQVDPNTIADDDPRRQIGKVCLRGDTKVVCRSGVKRLDTITMGDEVWDGANWIRHAGLVCNGRRPVLQLCGISLTPDHLVWSEGKWQRADALALSSEKLHSALVTARGISPSLGLLSGRRMGCARQSFSAIVRRLNIWYSQITSSVGYRPGATSAQTRRKELSATGNTWTQCEMMPTVGACSTVFPPLYGVAQNPTIKGGVTTAAEGFVFMPHGEKTAPSFYATYKLLKGGITRSWRWTVQTIMDITRRATSGSSLASITLKINERFSDWKQSALVYDLLSCGPKNRFMVMSDEGPLLVHNCELALQYYGGVGAFCSMAETYGLRLEDLAASAWPVISAAVKAEVATAWRKAVKRSRTYGLEERVWSVCHALVLMWRAAHPAITAFWAELDTACRMATRVPGKQFPVGKRIIVDRVDNWLRIRLPSGRYLCYPAPRGDDYTSSFLGVDPYTKQWKRIDTYSGKRAENIVQGGSADLLMDGLLAADEAGYNPVLSVHDEAITEPPDDDRYNDKDLSVLLANSSLWADGLPLAAKGFTAYRYRK